MNSEVHALVMNRHQKNYIFTNCSLWLYGKIRVGMLLYRIIELQCLTYKNNLQFMGAHELVLWVWKTWSHFLIHYISILYPLSPQKYSQAFYYKCRPLPASDILLNTLNSSKRKVVRLNYVFLYLLTYFPFWSRWGYQRENLRQVKWWHQK